MSPLGGCLSYRGQQHPRACPTWGVDTNNQIFDSTEDITIQVRTIPKSPSGSRTLRGVDWSNCWVCITFTVSFCPVLLHSTIFLKCWSRGCSINNLQAKLCLKICVQKLKLSQTKEKQTFGSRANTTYFLFFS